MNTQTKLALTAALMTAMVAGCATTNGGYYGIYWTQDFGRR